ncbi:hypothetical protein Vretifemale_12457 [Volvox reticuliferus]|nr:hypothetical protein Vretifemale_12457 [Volvox reticuliferus]
MKNREQINESLLTGVKALDILTPFGRGASLLVIGPCGSGKTRLALDAIAGQARWSGIAAATSSAASLSGVTVAAADVPTPPGGPVRCVLALVGRTKAEVQAVVSELRSSGSLFNTAVVAVDEGAPLGHQYAAMCCACSIGERVRDEGGHSLVVVDDIRPLSDVWEQLLGGLAGLGPALLREGLVKDERGRDMPVVPPPGSTSASAADVSPAAAAAADGATSSPTSASTAASASSPWASSSGSDSPAIDGAASGSSSGSGGGGGGGSGSLDDDEGALVEYEGMLVSGAVAQRRGFLSTFFMRAAKMSRSNGGGSMSLMPLVPGTCATGVSKRIDMSKYKTLSPEQLAKLEAALRAKMLAEELAAGAGSGELATEVVEEFISIADGQVVLEGPQQQRQQQLQGSTEASASSSPSSSSSLSGGVYTVNPKLSITRIGTRAYYKALEQLAPQVRLDLAQADDARRFGGAAAASTSSVASGSSIDLVSGGNGGVRLAAADLRADALARRLSVALLQAPGRPASLAEEVATLFAVQRGFADSIPPELLPGWLQGALQHVAATAPAAMQELGRTGILTAEAEAAISAALDGFGSGP